MFRNGLDHRTGVGMHGADFRLALTRHHDRLTARAVAGEENLPHPDQLGYGMVLSAKPAGSVYGDVRRVPAATVARRRAANRRARTARQAARR